MVYSAQSSVAMPFRATAPAWGSNPPGAVRWWAGGHPEGAGSAPDGAEAGSSASSGQHAMLAGQCVPRQGHIANNMHNTLQLFITHTHTRGARHAHTHTHTRGHTDTHTPAREGLERGCCRMTLTTARPHQAHQKSPPRVAHESTSSRSRDRSCSGRSHRHRPSERAPGIRIAGGPPACLISLSPATPTPAGA